MSDSTTCSTYISLYGVPSYSTRPTSSFRAWFYDPADVPMTFHNVGISVCGATGSVSLEYNNWNAPQTVPAYRLSTIEFFNAALGSCLLNGVLKMQGTDYNLVNN